MRHSYSGLAQPDSRRAVTSCAPRRVETPSPDGPADLRRFGLAQVDLFLQFGPVDSQIILRPRPGYVPKVPTTPFRDQVVSLQALPPEEADPALALLCPVRALRHYVDWTQSFRTSDQLLSVMEAGRKGMPSPSRGWPTG